MGKEKYYAVRRGRNPGIYLTWDKCKEQTDGFKGSQFKSFSTLPEAEQYIGNASAQSSSSKQHLGVLDGGVSKPRAEENVVVRTQAFAAPQQVHLRPSEVRGDGSSGEVYELFFDGASKGNPGKAGAGALLQRKDGTMVCELSEGLGCATNNVAEYRGLIIGLRAALERGISRIFVRGDSKLVCEQMMRRWKVHNVNLEPLWRDAMYLASQFVEFRIEHVLREFNPKADVLANVGVTMPETKFVSVCPGDYNVRQIA